MQSMQRMNDGLKTLAKAIALVAISAAVVACQSSSRSESESELGIVTVILVEFKQLAVFKCQLKQLL